MRRITMALLCLLCLPAITVAKELSEYNKLSMLVADAVMGSFEYCPKLTPSDGPMVLRELVKGKNSKDQGSTVSVIGEPLYRTVRKGNLDSIQVKYTVQEAWQQGWTFFSGRDKSALTQDCLVAVERRGEDGIAITRQGVLDINQHECKVFWRMGACPK